MSFASEQAARLETLLAKNPGVKSIAVDGVNVSFDDLTAQWERWQELARREAGDEPAILDLAMGGQ